MARYLVILLLINISSLSFQFELGHKIVNGYPIDISRRPFQASVRKNGVHLCGGSIIRDDLIITAAHCTHGYHDQPNLFTVYVGSTSKTSGGQEFKVRTIYQNKDYRPIDYDLSILKLDSNLTFSSKVDKITMNPTRPERGQTLYVSGWGSLYESGPRPDDLREVAVAAIDQASCNASYVGQITDRMVCAGFAEGGYDACKGDSGGPLVDEGSQLVGIVSWGAGCAQPGYPGVYASISGMYQWIGTVISLAT